MLNISSYLCEEMEKPLSMLDLSALEARRRALGLTTSSLISRCGITAPTWRGLCRGHGTLGSLSKALPVLGLTWNHAPGATPSEAGKALARLRRSQDMSQSALALRAGCTRPTVRSIETGMTGRIIHAAAILSVLGMAPLLRSADQNAGSTESGQKRR